MRTWLKRYLGKRWRESAANGDGRNCGRLFFALIVAFLLQSIFLPCLCPVGDARIRFAMIFDGLMLLRISVAHLVHERGEGWLFYAILIYSSPLWIRLVINHH